MLEQPVMADGTKVESVVFPARRLSATYEPATDTTTNVIVKVTGSIGCSNDTPVEADDQEILRGTVEIFDRVSCPYPCQAEIKAPEMLLETSETDVSRRRQRARGFRGEDYGVTTCIRRRRLFARNST